jgi:multiple sugar transport system ATP-binding protein
VASVAFEHVTKRFADGTVAVNDLSLEITDAEFMVVVGPSGCGKSTVLRMVAGLEDLTEGEIRIGDAVVNHIPSRNREVAMVFQSYALYPHMSVFDNIAFGLRMQGFLDEDIERRVNAAAKALELGLLLKRKPRELSGGEQQRVALGRAMVRDPLVFLLDEPLSSLDANLRVNLRAQLRRLHRTLHATFIYVTHDQIEAMTMADRVAVMRDGELQQVGSPQEVYDSPANVFVAGFIGSPTMNLIPVTVDGRTARASGFQIDLPFSPHVDRCILGFRPDALTECINDQHPSLDARVEVAEILGADQFVHASVGADAVIARVDPRMRVAPGDRLRLGIDLQRLHFFEPQTGRAIL